VAGLLLATGALLACATDPARSPLASSRGSQAAAQPAKAAAAGPRLDDADAAKTKARPYAVSQMTSAPEPEPIAPRYERYVLLEQALIRYRTLAADPALMPPPNLAGLRPGMRSPLVPALRRWLEALGDAAPANAATARSDVYDGVLVLDMKHFQTRHGLAVDGVIGKGTAQALQIPLRQRVRQIELTLDRWRSLPAPGPRPAILVNVPEFRLYTLRAEDERMAGGGDLDMKVIVGKALETETPELSGEMESVVFRPSWGVPRSIVVKEMLPKIRSNPGYLAKERLEIVGGKAPTQAVTKATLAGLASGALGLRQRPGRENSLGLLKFVVPNDEDIFLHGTPAESLFARPRRDFSHGCIRVEDPVALAEYVLRDQPAWTRARILAAIQTDSTSQVELLEPIPVHVEYMTAVAQPGGEVRFFEDLYGRDAELEKRLEGGYPDR
jgi:murein L,D-transpeptidase YcbB/YkuD